MTDSFRINTPQVVAETLDGETTIVNLDTGTYYALNHSGSLVWDGLIAGSPVAEVGGALATRYGIDLGEAASATERLAEELKRHDLITEGTGSRTNGNGRVAPAEPNGEASAYTEPELNTYTDMQELLLLDPIHEVDESGWPNRPF